MGRAWDLGSMFALDSRAWRSWTSWARTELRTINGCCISGDLESAGPKQSSPVADVVQRLVKAACVVEKEESGVPGQGE